MNHTHLALQAINNGAVLYGSLSGGKDGQAMVNVLIKSGLKIEGLVHADLGSMEWPESMGMCKRQSVRYNIPLHVVTRHDGYGLFEHIRRRMEKLTGTGKPFWPSSTTRYCTSDTKREPINKFLRNCGHDFIISCEGIRAEESAGRARKDPIAIRVGMTSTYYDGMSVGEAIAALKPGKRLALTWYPIFEYTLPMVWATEAMTPDHLARARMQYENNYTIPEWWQFHPAYVYGNDRVSCMFCVLGSKNDLEVAALHNPTLLRALIDLEEEGDSTFKNRFSLKELGTQPILT